MLKFTQPTKGSSINPFFLFFYLLGWSLVEEILLFAVGIQCFSLSRLPQGSTSYLSFSVKL